jgi:hypothetical protein
MKNGVRAVHRCARYAGFAQIRLQKINLARA